VPIIDYERAFLALFCGEIQQLNCHYCASAFVPPGSPGTTPNQNPKLLRAMNDGDITKVIVEKIT
jgi:hypothetical protein